MIVVLQRVARAAVRAPDRQEQTIGRGYCLLACAVDGDAPEDAAWLGDKIADLRLFEDERGLTNRDLGQVAGAVLLVPQFTLAADWRKGRRPSFTRAAAPGPARALVGVLAERLAERGIAVRTGPFGAAMEVELVNQGPFTLVLDSAVRPGRRPGPST